MAEEFQAAVCGGSLWMSPRTAFNRSWCPSVITDMDNFEPLWPKDFMDMKSKSSDDSSDGSMVFQDIHEKPSNDTATMSPESAFQMMATNFSDSLVTSTTDNWNQNLLFREQEGMNTYSTSGDDGSTAVIDGEHQEFTMEQQQSLNFTTTTHVYPSSLLPSLFNSSSPPPVQPPTQQQQPLYNFKSNSNNFNTIQSVPLVKLKQQVPGNFNPTNINAPFWNASTSLLDDNIASFFPLLSSQFLPSAYKEKESYSNLTKKPNHQEIQDLSSIAKKSSGEPPFKRPRLETPSPLPTFKVRKEKLGDRITALQQLVSPFGKTDTASVLHEAIEYIKLLHDQLHILSAPYMKNGATNQLQQIHEKMNDVEGHTQDLKSLGLCLVPVSSTFPVATEMATGFWTPTFEGSFK